MSEPESGVATFMRPLSFEAIAALVVALINLALDQADIHIMTVSWLSVILCTGLVVDAMRRTKWASDPRHGRRRLIAGSTVATVIFLAFGVFLSSHKNRESTGVTGPAKEQAKQIPSVPPSLTQEQVEAAVRKAIPPMATPKTLPAPLPDTELDKLRLRKERIEEIKKRGTALAEEIAKWCREESAFIDKVRQSYTGPDAYNRQQLFNRYMAAEFYDHGDFGVRLIKLRNELASEGVVDAHLDLFLKLTPLGTPEPALGPPDPLRGDTRKFSIFLSRGFLPDEIIKAIQQLY